jgi:hypothetical protein
MRSRLIIAVGVWVASLGAVAGQRALTPSAMREHAAIGYSKTAPADPVAELGRQLEAGEIELAFRSENGYLESVLKALDVPVTSQMLVFSKTSFQAPRISPQNPRAIFFNDTVAVGWVRGGEVLEFIGYDPRQGAMFYTMEQSAGKPPKLNRNMACVQCHTFADTLDVPSMFTGSVFPGPTGVPWDAPGNSTDHRTPFEFRWGGWFVTGHHRIEQHVGNVTFPDSGDYSTPITPATIQADSLEGRFDATGYPAAGSDIAAMLLMNHQARMLSLMTRIGWDVRLGSESSRRLNESAEELVDYMLFAHEAPLPGPITGNGFAKDFAARGVRDSKGRSLRDLDLTSRLMRYPCSPLIYSAVFDGMPDAAREAVYARLWAVLSGEAKGAAHARLSAADRQAILEILRETKRGLPSFFFASS